MSRTPSVDAAVVAARLQAGETRRDRPAAGHLLRQCRHGGPALATIERQ